MPENFTYRTLTWDQANFLDRYCANNNIDYKIWGAFNEIGLKESDWAKVNRFLEAIDNKAISHRV